MGALPGSYDNLDAITDDASAPPPASPPAPPASAPDDGYVSSNIPAIVTFLTKNVPPPSPLYLSLEDTIVLTVANRDPALNSVLCSIRLLRADGGVYIQNIPLANIPSDGSISVVEAQLAEGFMLSAEVGPTSDNPQRGQTFIQLGLLHGRSGGAIFTQQLIADYISNQHIPSWPGGTQIHSVDGPGHLRAITGTQPTPGNDILETVPVNVRWRLVTFRSALHTSAAAANRQVKMVVSSGGVISFAAGSPVTQPASVPFGYVMSPGSTAQSDGFGVITLPGPLGQSLLPGMTIGTATTNLDAGDQWDAPLYLVEEWIER